MKTLLLLALLAASFAASNLQGQIYITGAPEPVPAVVYQAPVVYQVPVVYEAPVVYQAPVVFQAPVQFDLGGAGCCRPSPNVIYVGGPCAYRNAAYQYNPGSPVIYFGRGESYQRGYQFSHPR
jgi:hypothetical protein